MPRKEVDREVASMLQDLQLVDKTKTAAKNLSGGMKRKLRYSMCVADQGLWFYILPTNVFVHLVPCCLLFSPF